MFQSANTASKRDLKHNPTPRVWFFCHLNQCTHSQKYALCPSAGDREIKRVVVVDEDIDISSAEEVEWAIATRVQPQRDLVIIDGAHGSGLDPSAGEHGETGEWGIDATIPFGADRQRYERIRTPRRAQARGDDQDSGEHSGE